jgi:RNA polymerase sigma factor (TIGR02999 family)
MEDQPGPTASDSPDERHALDDVFCATYAELRRLASSVKRTDRSLTLTPTALVHEAWLKLARAPHHVTSVSRLHFKRIAARAMRQVLVESARRRQASKRGGGEIDVLEVTFDESFDQPVMSERELIALDIALDDLSRMHPRQAQTVEARFFGGLSSAEIAELLAVSEATVLRDWRVARAWLSRQLHHSHHRA